MLPELEHPAVVIAEPFTYKVCTDHTLSLAFLLAQHRMSSQSSVLLASESLAPSLARGGQKHLDRKERFAGTDRSQSLLHFRP